jgi:chitobiase/beta-hexosaminidase-like protein/List-Bact-rpt repeat protein
MRSAVKPLTWLLLALSLLASPPLACAQDFAMDWFTIDGGGGTSSSADYSLSGTIGQPDAGILTGDSYIFEGGFWGLIAALSSATVPVNTCVQGNGMVVRSPDQPLYTNGQAVTLTAMPTNCYWRFSQWSDGVTNNPRTVVAVGLTNCFTAVFTNIVNGCETNGPRPFGAPVIIVNGQAVTNDSVTVSNFASVEIQTSFPNGRIYYTFDCSRPTTGSTNYTGPFTVIGILTVRAVAVSEDSSQIVESCPVTIRVEPHSECPNPFSFFQLAATTFGGEGHGGTVRRVPAFTPYPCEKVVTVIASPDTGWEFLGWLGGADGPNPSVTFTMNRDICAQAVFAAPLMTFTNGHGSVVRQPDAALYPYGTEVRLTAAPDAGYFFTNWTGVVEGSDNPLNVIADNPYAVLIANFAPLPANRYALTTRIEGHGQVQVDTYDYHYAAGTLVTNTAQADANQTFVRWEGDTNGAVFLDPTRLVLTMNTSKVVTAHFTSRPQLDVVRCLGALNHEGFELSVTGELGARYFIRATASLNGPAELIPWITLGEVTNTLGVVEFIDITNTNFTKRFYRAQEAP